MKTQYLGIPYKYVVYSPRMNEVGHPYEFLHGAPPYDHPRNNRLLKVPEQKLCQGGNQLYITLVVTNLLFRLSQTV